MLDLLLRTPLRANEVMAKARQTVASSKVRKIYWGDVRRLAYLRKLWKNLAK